MVEQDRADLADGKKTSECLIRLNQILDYLLSLIFEGLKTASYFWTGSEVWPQTPDVYVIFDPKVDFKRRCDEIVNWFQKLNMDFITLYFDEPDAIGHEFGPESVQYQNKVGI
jgi:hypothetical protein